MLALTSVQETNLFVLGRKISTSPSLLAVRELERRHFCCARRRMAPKQGVRKRPAAGSHETLFDMQPGFPLEDASARSPVLHKTIVFDQKSIPIPPPSHARNGADCTHPQTRRCCVQLVRGHGDFPARQLQVDFGAPKCRIVDRALTRN